MKLLLKKNRADLAAIFNTSFDGDWPIKEADGLYQPRDAYPVITNERPVKLQAISWGFPLYLDDNQTMLKTISEVGVEWIFDKPMFECITSKRCLIPFELNNELMYGAGVWDVFTDKKGNQIRYFTLLTTQSKKTRERIPYVLDGVKYKKWLSDKNIEKPDLQNLID